MGPVIQGCKRRETLTAAGSRNRRATVVRAGFRAERSLANLEVSGFYDSTMLMLSDVAVV
jgi:hypothetical protein